MGGFKCEGGVGRLACSILGYGLEWSEAEVRETGLEAAWAGVQGLSEQRCVDLD